MLNDIQKHSMRTKISPIHACKTDSSNEEVKYCSVPRLQLDTSIGSNEEVKPSVPISQLNPPATMKEKVEVPSITILQLDPPTSELNPPTSELIPPTSELNPLTLRKNIPLSELIPPTSELNPPIAIQLRESLSYAVLSKQPNFRRNNRIPNLPPGLKPNPARQIIDETSSESESYISYSSSYSTYSDYSDSEEDDADYVSVECRPRRPSPPPIPPYPYHIHKQNNSTQEVYNDKIVQSGPCIPVNPVQSGSSIPVNPVQSDTLIHSNSVQYNPVIPLNPVQSRPGTPLHPVQSGSSIPLNPVQSGPSIPVNPVQSGPSILLNPVQSDTLIHSNPVEYNPVIPLNSVQSRPGTPLNPVQSEPSIPLKPVQLNTLIHSNLVQYNPVIPVNPVQSRPGTPLNPVQSRPGTPLNPVQSEPSIPLNPVQLNTLIHSNPVQYNPVIPVNPVQSRPGTPLNPVQSRPGTPLNPVQSEPSIPLNPVKLNTLIHSNPVQYNPVIPLHQVQSSPITTSQPVQKTPIESLNPLPLSPSTQDSEEIYNDVIQVDLGELVFDLDEWKQHDDHHNQSTLKGPVNINDKDFLVEMGDTFEDYSDYNPNDINRYGMNVGVSILDDTDSEVRDGENEERVGEHGINITAKKGEDSNEDSSVSMFESSAFQDARKRDESYCASDTSDQSDGSAQLDETITPDGVVLSRNMGIRVEDLMGDIHRLALNSAGDVGIGGVSAREVCPKSKDIPMSSTTRDSISVSFVTEMRIPRKEEARKVKKMGSNLSRRKKVKRNFVKSFTVQFMFKNFNLFTFNRFSYLFVIVMFVL